MSILEDIADGLARDALRLEEDLNDLDIVEKIAKQIGTASPTVEEAFRTAIRMRRAERIGRNMMESLRGTAGRATAERQANLPARRGGSEGKA